MQSKASPSLLRRRAYEQSLLLRLAGVVDSPYSRLITKVVLAGDDDTPLWIPPIDSSDYEDPRHFAEDYLLHELLRKSPNQPGRNQKEREAEAIRRFHEGNDGCLSTTRRLLARAYRPIVGPLPHRDKRDVGRDDVHPSWVGEVAAKVDEILGPLTDGALSLIGDLCRHGPGAVVGTPGVGIPKSEKWRNGLTSTAKAAPFIRAFTGLQSLLPTEASDVDHQHPDDYPLWDSGIPVTVVSGSEFFTVPKDAETERGAAKEPGFNAFGQLGIGEYIAHRLRRFGCDLTDQEKNKELSRGAFTKRRATLDLKNASNCSSLGMILTLFPERWVHLLDIFRSDTIAIEGVEYPLHMWSTMGNGYTFPIESTVFLAVCLVAVPCEEHADVGVYGDDIIVPTAYAGRVIEMLDYLGFSVNGSKSFLAGNFFESCGAYWFRDQDVRPFRCDREKGSQIPYGLQLANALRLWMIRVYGYSPVRFKPVWEYLTADLKGIWKEAKVPPSFGDTGLIVGVEERPDLGRDAPLCALGHDATLLKALLLGHLNGGPRPGRNVLGHEGFSVRFVRMAPVESDIKDLAVWTSSFHGGRKLKAKKGPALNLAERLTRQLVCTSRSTNGVEPVRGLYGRLVTSWGHSSEWPSLAWL